MGLSIDRRLKKLNLLKSRAVDLAYFDNLSMLFERVAWITLSWAFVLNFFSPVSQTTKQRTFILIVIVALLLVGYFRVLYSKVRSYSFRFYFIDIGFPVFTWLFLHLQPNFTSQFVIPYYVIVLVSSLTRRRFDTLLALGVSSLLILTQEMLPATRSIEDLGTAFSQIIALILFAWVAIWLVDFDSQKENETKDILEDFSKENEKSEILKKYAQTLAIDKEKAQIFLAESNRPILVLNSQKKIEDLNQAFKDFSDFKSDNLIGRDLDYVLRFDSPLDFSEESYLVEKVSGVLTTRRNKERKINASVHFLRSHEGKVKQGILIISPPS